MPQDYVATLATRNMFLYSKPYDTANALPALTVLYGGTWTGFSDMGYTDQGVDFKLNVSRTDIRVDQSLDPIAKPATGRDITFTSNLAQFTPQNLQIASSLGAVTTVAPASGTRGSDTLDIGSTITDTFYSWAFDAQQPNGESDRGIIYRGLATGSPSPKVGVAGTLAAIALEITALVDTSTSPARVASFQRVLPAA